MGRTDACPRAVSEVRAVVAGRVPVCLLLDVPAEECRADAAVLRIKRPAVGRGTMKRSVVERRQRNLELAARDQANRCAECRRNLNEVSIVMEDFLIDGKFCSDECLRQRRSRDREQYQDRTAE